MKYSLLIATILCIWAATSHAKTGFDQRYERGYNIFNPATQYQPDNPLNPANAYDSNSAFNPVNRYDPGNPANPINQYSPNNPFNPVNRYHPDNPLNPANKPALFTRVRDETTEMPRETGAWSSGDWLRRPRRCLSRSQNGDRRREEWRQSPTVC